MGAGNSANIIVVCRVQVPSFAPKMSTQNGYSFVLWPGLCCTGLTSSLLGNILEEKKVSWLCGLARFSGFKCESETPSSFCCNRYM